LPPGSADPCQRVDPACHGGRERGCSRRRHQGNVRPRVWQSNAARRGLADLRHQRAAERTVQGQRLVSMPISRSCWFCTLSKLSTTSRGAVSLINGISFCTIWCSAAAISPQTLLWKSSTRPKAPTADRADLPAARLGADRGTTQSLLRTYAARPCPCRAAK
jgi:hypothetical protein